MKNNQINLSAESRLTNRVVAIYQERYPRLFGIEKKEAKDAVRFTFRPAK